MCHCAGFHETSAWSTMLRKKRMEQISWKSDRLVDKKLQKNGHGFHKRSLMRFAGGRQLYTIEGFLRDWTAVAFVKSRQHQWNPKVVEGMSTERRWKHNNNWNSGHGWPIQHPVLCGVVRQNINLCTGRWQLRYMLDVMEASRSDLLICIYLFYLFP